MADKEHQEDPNAELLPPREAMSLLNTDPAAYTGLLGDPTAGGSAPTPDQAAGAAGSAQHLVDAQALGDAQESSSDGPQTVTTDSTQTASSET